MAIQQTQAFTTTIRRRLVQKDYGKQLTGLTAIPLDTARFAPQVAGQDPLQTQAYNLATQGQGIGAYQPYLTQAGAIETYRLQV